MNVQQQQLVRWYKQDVERWRTGAAMLWCGMIVLRVAFSFLTIALLDPLHPFEYMYNCIQLMVSPYNWLHVIGTAVIVTTLGLVNCHYYTVKPVILPRRITILWYVLHPGRLLHIAIHTLAGGLVVLFYCHLVGGRHATFVKPCDVEKEELCLNEQQLFLVVHGALVGATYSAEFFLAEHNYLAFSRLQECKFFMIKNKVMGQVWDSLMTVLRWLRYFYPLYYLFFGKLFRDLIITNVNIYQNEADAVDTVAGMLDVGLFWNVVISAVYTYVLFSLSCYFYKAFQRERHEFPVEIPFDESPTYCLHQILPCSAYPLLQYLGFLDLYLLSRYSPRRRKEIFSLSQLGGHPRNWNAIKQECLTSLNFFTEDVVRFNNKILLNGMGARLGTVVPEIKKQTLLPVSPVHKDSGSSSYSSNIGEQSYYSVLTHRSFQASTTSAAVTSCTSAPAIGAVTPAAVSTLAPVTSAQSADNPFVRPVKKLYKKLLSSCWPLSFLLAELPEAASRTLFIDAQIHIWTVEALSYLVSASYAEDAFGVVQRSLVEILTTLLSLYEAVEKHFKVAVTTSHKNPRALGPHSDVTLRHALRATLRTAIYRIVTTFGKHLSAVPLSGDHERRLRNFIEFKE
ncbi:Nucleoporin NDC1 [Lamellibrachia satsuma]|nr:Nucleoporin NDC1 [Lamellibrachia satsuma]